MVGTLITAPDLISVFGSVFSGAKVASPSPISDEVMEAYEALTNDELLFLAGYDNSRIKTEDKSLLRAACAERSLLDSISYGSFYSFESYSERDGRDGLAKKLNACVEARQNKETKELALLGGFPLGMFTPEANIALTKLLNEVIAFPFTKKDLSGLLSMYRIKIDQLGAIYSEVHDTAVREEIYAYLETNNVHKSILEGLTS